MVCAGLLVFGSFSRGSDAFSYLLWNIFLAGLPLLFALRLAWVLRTKRWSAWGPIGWSLLWLLFLPNSFYMISDYIHLKEISRDDILYNSVMFTSFIYLGVLVGFCSLYVVHNQLRRRLQGMAASLWIGATLFVCSCAIYIGRDLRWNSWDVLFNPAGLLFDISDRLLRPDAYPDMIVTIVSFFVLLASLYAVFYSGAKLLRSAEHVKN
jgi:uncharacterized membrane protein